jgi:hypothetical protein
MAPIEFGTGGDLEISKINLIYKLRDSNSSIMPAKESHHQTRVERLFGVPLAENAVRR